MKRKILYILGGCIFLFLIVHFFSRKTSPPEDTPNVTVSSVIQKDMIVNLQTIGTVQAYSTVEVKSMVTGPLKEIGFKEGEVVQQNQILFMIDERPFEAALNQAKATLARDLALYENARLQVKRNTPLVRKGFTAKQDYDTLVANEKSAAATLKADEAAVTNAELQLSYATIHAPIAGRTGNILLKIGSLVKANDTSAIVTINQINPIYVSFSVPQNYLFNIQKNLKQNVVKVKALVGNDLIDEGDLTFIDNSVNVATGTIQLKATFPNKDRLLWPGQYVNVSFPIENIKQALVIPLTALLTNQKGFYVYVITPGETATIRSVTPGDTVGNEVIIEAGLQVGERIVTAGHLKLREGMKVNIIKSSTG